MPSFLELGGRGEDRCEQKRDFVVLRCWESHLRSHTYKANTLDPQSEDRNPHNSEEREERRLASPFSQQRSVSS